MNADRERERQQKLKSIVKRFEGETRSKKEAVDDSVQTVEKTVGQDKLSKDVPKPLVKKVAPTPESTEPETQGEPFTSVVRERMSEEEGMQRAQFYRAYGRLNRTAWNEIHQMIWTFPPELSEEEQQTLKRLINEIVEKHLKIIGAFLEEQIKQGARIEEWMEQSRRFDWKYDCWQDNLRFEGWKAYNWTVGKIARNELRLDSKLHAWYEQSKIPPNPFSDKKVRQKLKEKALEGARVIAEGFVADCVTDEVKEKLSQKEQERLIEEFEADLAEVLSPQLKWRLQQFWLEAKNSGR